MLKFFSRLMSSPPLQALIVRRNFFVTTGMKRTFQAKVTDAEFEHYTAVVPTPESRKGIAVFPKQIRLAKPWLAELEQRVTANLGDKPMVLVWGTKDPVVRGILKRWESKFPHAKVIRIDKASHYLQEDEPEQIAEAIANAYGPKRN